MVQFASAKANWWWSGLAFFNAVVIRGFLYGSARGYYVLFIPGLLTILLFAVEFLPLLGVSNPKKPRAGQKLRHRSVREYWLAIGVLLPLLGVMAYMASNMDFWYQHTYLIPSTQPDSVVLRIYGDKVICAPLSGNTTVERSFFSLNISEPNMTLTLHSFPGRLSVAKK